MKKSAFTLVELSIVLVIIGLIVAGVMAGQSLVKQAQLRSTLPLRGNGSPPPRGRQFFSSQDITSFLIRYLG